MTHLLIVCILYCLLGRRDIQTYTKESLCRRLRNYLSNDWLPINKAKSFPLKQFYVELNWTKKIKGLRDRQEPMNRIHDIFTLNIGSSAVTVLVRGMLQIKDSAYIEHIHIDLRSVHTKCLLAHFIKTAHFLISIVSMETAHFFTDGSHFVHFSASHH